MPIEFQKYQGTGNDFVLVDDREGHFPVADQELVQRLCDRRFGIGADGLILFQQPKSPDFDFHMFYFNADGRESSMCGNGGRCITHFAANSLGLRRAEYRFTAADGPHESTLLADGRVSLGMADVGGLSASGADFVLDTGSPHFVRFVDDAKAVAVPVEGKAVRNSPPYVAEGINVNFVERGANGQLFVRTYERGVEDETLSCGTGVTAAAVAASGGAEGHHFFAITTPGGKLEVTFEKSERGFTNIRLIGPATPVFKGVIEV